MPKSTHDCVTDDDFCADAKNLRSSTTSKRLRHLRAFERTYYKKTCEVKKTGHGLQDIHCLNDGGLRYTSSQLTYSLNKKKRWLLPQIIEQRICEYDPKPDSSKEKNKNQDFNIDERLKIEMYENENTKRTSTCLRYANNQIEPHVLHKNGGRFNSTTLKSWINFQTHGQRNRRHRRNSNDDDRVNQPNFGIQQRPGFFPSEVTYEFLYPKRSSSSLPHKNGKSSLSYCGDLRDGWKSGRDERDTNKNRRTVRRFDCLWADIHGQDYDLDEEDIDDQTFITTSSDLLDENEKWSIAFDDTNDELSISLDFPIDYFIPSFPSNVQSPSSPDDDTLDHKAYKYYEPLPTPIDKQIEEPSSINEELLCSISCPNESTFLSVMQQSTMNTSQANLSPGTFLQRTVSSSFSVVYTYCRTSSTINATLKFTQAHPILTFDRNQITLEQLLELVSTKLDQYQLKTTDEPSRNARRNVDALRGSLPLPIHLSQNMLLVRPKSTDKQTALQLENINVDNKQQQNQWFDTIKDEYEMFECSICCEILTANDAYQLLPCHHSICHACLTSYIRTSVSSAIYSSSNTSSITCFQSNCLTQLNCALLQAFISFEIYQSYKQSLIDRQLFSSGNYRKCPSRDCSKLLIIDDNTKFSSMCSCGQRVCLNCFEEYHFPATCEQYKSYMARLRESGDDLLSVSKLGDNSHCYISEGKNCPNCGEFVEKNGGCPHMTCRCGNEYCWGCLKPWLTHNSATCHSVPESTHELRSSTRNRLHDKAIGHRRQRNQYSYDLLSSTARQSKACSMHHDILLATYIDLNTLAEFLYVLLQRRRTNHDIRAVLGQTAKRLESDAFQIELQIQSQKIKTDYIEIIRSRLARTVLNLLHMKKNKVLI